MLAPIHSLQVRGRRNQIPKMAMRKGSSNVKMGWTVVSRPKCRARNCKRNAAISTVKPAIHTVRRIAYAMRLNLRFVSAGADSTPIRCRTLVKALANAAMTAST